MKRLNIKDIGKVIGMSLLAFTSVSCQPKSQQKEFVHTTKPLAFDGSSIEIEGELYSFEASLTPISSEDGVQIIRLKLHSDVAAVPKPIELKWQIPSSDIFGFWTPKISQDKANYYYSSIESTASRYAPILTFYNAQDVNRFTVSCSDALNKVAINSELIEEDANFHLGVELFKERMPATTDYEMEIRIDTRSLPFYKSIDEVASWWADMDLYKPAPVPDDAKKPMYSTWYSFHQNLDVDKVLNECKIGKEMGLDAVIVDDGWQTMDSKRGYAYTGDWDPERIPEMAKFVEGVHDLEMKFILWYSVPFMGKNAKHFNQFKGKYLEYWESQGTYVLDPRYPEVREYIIQTYEDAMKDWNLDGFKLDFIGWFKAYPDTELTKENGRDYASVNQATDRLMTDIMTRLRDQNSEVMIEFRQPYIGPVMRKYGNMFRACDCPNMENVNRVRIADIRLMCGNTAPHSDMFMWHKDDPVESAALQILNVLYSVPQVSVLLQDSPKSHFEMVQYWMAYWKKNRAVLLDGDFVPTNPSALYPILSSTKSDKQITAVYNDIVCPVSDVKMKKIDLINAKYSTNLVVDFKHVMGHAKVKVLDCMGTLKDEYTLDIEKGIQSFNVPSSGLISIVL